ncbi:MAG: type II toxin-antitoxin system Phd/YefM family antitoxin [Caldilinea sp.]
MDVKTLDSNQARNHWREMLDTVLVSNTDVVITRYNQPVAAIVAYEDYLAIVTELNRVRAERSRRKALAESRATMYASESMLAREWDTQEEDEAWAHL